MTLEIAYSIILSYVILTIGFYETIIQNTLHPAIFEMWSAIFFALKNARDNKILFTFQLLNKTMKFYNSERNRSYLRYFKSTKMADHILEMAGQGLFCFSS